VKKHFPFVVMVLGAGSQLLTSLLLYKYLDPNSYGLFGLYMTFLSLVFSFGVFGAEQAFMRECQIQNERVSSSKNILLIVLVSFVLGPLLLAVSAYFTFLSQGNVLILLCLAYAGALVMMAYNFLRITQYFVYSQIVQNLWRFFIAFSLISVVIFNAGINFVLNMCLFGLVMAVIIFVFLYFRVSKNKLEISAEGMSFNSSVKLTVSFLFSMGVLTATSFFDRYFVGSSMSVEQFGEFFLLQNVFVYPILLLANYIGFKSLVRYKKELNLKQFNMDFFKLIIILPIIMLLYWYCVLIVDGFFDMGFYFSDKTNVIIPLLIFGIVKTIYSLLSAAVGARGSAKSIYLANFMSLLSVFIVGVVLINIDVTMEIIVWCMVVIWLLRSGFYYLGVRASA
jgi:O-antigen/teichoic acid export membrane protein